MKRIITVVIHYVIYLISCSCLVAGEIKLQTSDGCLLSAYEKILSTTSPVLLEVHGLGSDRKEWDKFNSFLEKENINYLSLDLRGHGKSILCSGKRVNYKNFSIQDWRKILLDWQAGADRLLKKFPPQLIIPAGASIGANSAVIFSSGKKFPGLILLSPGYDYVDLKPASELEKIKAPLFFSYSPSDYYSAKSCSYFSSICSQKKLDCRFLKAETGHGVQIFESPHGAEYAAEIIKFVKDLQNDKKTK